MRAETDTDKFVLVADDRHCQARESGRDQLTEHLNCIDPRVLFRSTALVHHTREMAPPVTHNVPPPPRPVRRHR